MRFGVIVNPLAGRNRRVSDRARRLRAVVADDGVVCEPRTVERLAEAVRELRSERIDVLAVCGGDGSYFRTLSVAAALYGDAALPAFLLLRGGTMNTVARGVRAPLGRPEVALARVLARQRRGKPLRTRPRQLLRVNDELSGFMVGAGTIVSFLQTYYAGAIQGPLGAAMLMARLASAVVNGAAERMFRWVDAEVTCDGRRVPFERFSVIYAATIKEIGLGFRPTYRANDRLGEFHLIAGPMGAVETARCLPAIRRGRPTHSPSLFDALGCRVAVEFSAPTPYMIDGDVLAPVSALRIEVGPVVAVVSEETQR